MKRLGRIVGVLVCVVALLTSAHVMIGAYGPRPADRAQQSLVDALEREIADGAAEQAQQSFPEGAYFTHVLTGIAQARLGGPDNLERARAHLAAVQTDVMLARFGAGMVPEHGIFVSGWALQLAVDIAAASGAETDVAEAARLATEVAGAVERSPTPYLESYPGQYWPCDSVVAVAGLARAVQLPGVAGPDADRWLRAGWQWRAASNALHPAGTLLPHRTDADGEALEGPRGSSQAIIQTFWPALAADDERSWSTFVETFVTREAGLVGVREHPAGTDGVGDVDSGPLVLGVSLSATAVTLGAARANGAEQLAATLDREAEVFGLPSRIGPRRYAAGALPVGEAFLSFARSRTPIPTVGGHGGTSADHPASLRPWWVLWWGPGVAVAVLLWWRIRPRRNNPHHDNPAQAGS